MYRTPRPLAKLAPRTSWHRLAWAWCRGVFRLVAIPREISPHSESAAGAWTTTVLLRARQRPIAERHARYLRRRYGKLIANALSFSFGYRAPHRLDDAAILRLARAGALWRAPDLHHVIAVWAGAPIPQGTSAPNLQSRAAPHV